MRRSNCLITQISARSFRPLVLSSNLLSRSFTSPGPRSHSRSTSVHKSTWPPPFTYDQIRHHSNTAEQPLDDDEADLSRAESWRSFANRGIVLDDEILERLGIDEPTVYLKHVPTGTFVQCSNSQTDQELNRKLARKLMAERLKELVNPLESDQDIEAQRRRRRKRKRNKKRNRPPVSDSATS